MEQNNDMENVGNIRNTDPIFNIGDIYKITKIQDIFGEEDNTNRFNNHTCHLIANTFVKEILGVPLKFKEEITHLNYTYNIFEANSLKNENNEEYNITSPREVSFIKIRDNNENYNIFKFKPVFESI